MRKRLPRDGHTAFKAIGDRREALVTPPQIQIGSDHETFEELQTEKPGLEDDEELPL